MFENMLIVVFLLMIIILFVLKWLMRIRAAMVNMLLFVLLAIYISINFVMYEYYWGLLPVLMGLLAMGRYVYDVALEKDE